jgi:hypothetical protein
MPPRKRHRKAPPNPDPIARFGEALKRADERERAERKRVQAERAERARLARLAAEHAEAVRVAKIELERSIGAAKAARQSGSGVAEADGAWRKAKARMIELETGEAPAWGPE